MYRYLILLTLFLCSSVGFAAPTGNTQFFGGDANVVFHLDVQRLQNGQTPKSLLGMVMMNPKAKEGITKFKSQFGLDPFKDIQSLTGQVTLRERGTDPLVLLHIQGKFDQVQFLKGLTEEGNSFKAETVNGYTLQISEANKSALTFIQGGILMGSPEQLRQAVKGAKFTGALVKQQKKLINGGDLWFVAQFPEKMRKEMQLKNPAMTDASALRGFVDFAKGLHINLITELSDASSASKAATDLNASVTQAKSSPQAAMFMNMMNKFEAKAKSNELIINLPLNQDEVNQIQAIVGMMMMSLTANQAAAGGPAPSFPGLKAPVAPSSLAKPIPAKPIPKPATKARGDNSASHDHHNH